MRAGFSSQYRSATSTDFFLVIIIGQGSPTPPSPGPGYAHSTGRVWGGKESHRVIVLFQERLPYPCAGERRPRTKTSPHPDLPDGASLASVRRPVSAERADRRHREESQILCLRRQD